MHGMEPGQGIDLQDIGHPRLIQAQVDAPTVTAAQRPPGVQGDLRAAFPDCGLREAVRDELLVTGLGLVGLDARGVVAVHDLHDPDDLGGLSGARDAGRELAAGKETLEEHGLAEFLQQPPADPLERAGRGDV